MRGRRKVKLLKRINIRVEHSCANTRLKIQGGSSKFCQNPFEEGVCFCHKM